MAAVPPQPLQGVLGGDRQAEGVEGLGMEAGMRAIWLRQPWATLVAIGVKEWETRGAPPNGPMRPDGVRGMPGLAIEPGERIVIVASKAAPTTGKDVGDWYWEDTAADPECIIHWGPWWRKYEAPLGVVVCTVVVAEALPIVDDADDLADEPSLIEVTPSASKLLRFQDGEDEGADISVQLPYGDWTPGRWAWRLTDMEPVTGRPEPVVTRGNRQGVCEIEETWT